MRPRQLDCVVIGYYEPPFGEYREFLHRQGVGSEAYRDLQLNFVNLNGAPMRFIDLLNHCYNEVHGGDSEVFKSGDIPNLAAAYLTQYLRRAKHRVEFINLFPDEQDKLREYLNQKPLCVAITTTFYVLNAPVIDMVKWIRAHSQDVKIIVGGPLIANHARNSQETPNQPIAIGSRPTLADCRVNDVFRTALEDIGADIFIIEAQGEATLARVVGCLGDGGDLAAVPNIAYRDRGVIRINPSLPENNSLDNNAIDWTSFSGRDLGRTIQTRTARSCAFNCSFCNYPTRAGALTLASLDAIQRELDSIRTVGVENVVFVDDTFNVPMGRFKEICRIMIDRNYGFKWFSYFRCSNADEEAIELAARSGCKGVFLGVESGSPAMLKNMNKAATIEKYAEGIRRLHDHGVTTFASFITGFPGETEDSIAETVDFIRQNRPTYYRTQLWYCEPGTPIQQQRDRYKIEGRGFVWSHSTMDSLEASDHIDRIFLSVNESVWLPQWSFDFWIIPYLMGKGFTPDSLLRFMRPASRMLALEIASMPPSEKTRLQRALLAEATQPLCDITA
jgi:p-methyltransferase